MSYTTQYDMIEEVRNGSSEGCMRFYRTYAPLVRAHGRDCGVPGSELDDLVQSVMFGFFRNGVCSYDPARGHFRTYLRQVIRARSMDLLRKLYRKRDGEFEIFQDHEYLDRRYDEEWNEYLCEEVLTRLRHRVGPERYQQFRMLALEKRDVRSVADAYKVSPSAIYASFNRTRCAVSAIMREIESRGG